MKKSKNKKHSLLLILLLLIVGISIGYAALATTLNINGNTTIEKASWDIHFENLVKTSGSEVATVEAAIDSTKTLIEYTITLTEPGDFYEFTVDIVNNGTIDAMISEVLKEGLTTDQEKYIEYTATYSDGVELQELNSLKSGTKENIKVRVKYRDDITASDLPTESTTLTLKFRVAYIQDNGNSIERNTLYNKISSQAVMDNVASEYVTNPNGISLNILSSNTNGKGVYIISSTSNNDYPIHYYRGAVDNNNVKFANFCWKIVRTTETGGVKLIYNGLPDSNGYCTNKTGETTTIGRSVFNSGYDDNAYVGYMYGSIGASTYEETHKNENDSVIKTVIDNWYEKNMTSYTNKLEDTVWCNDRSVVTNSSYYPGNGVGGSKSTMYGPRDRLSRTPSLNCINQNDRFTVDTANGNGALTYPVALLTADEVRYAGGAHGSPNDDKIYLYTAGSGFWTLSPFHYGSRNDPKVLDFNVSMTDYSVGNSDGVRPSVSLKPGIVTIGGDGTDNSPYIVE